MPRYHRSPTLLRVAAALRQRAERTGDDLHQQHSAQTLALAAAQQEIADLHRQLAERLNNLLLLALRYR